MSKNKKRMQTGKAAGLKSILEDTEHWQPAIVFLSISLALFLAFVGFFAWHTAIMRNYELNYVRAEGTVIGIEEHHGSSGIYHGASRTYYYLLFLIRLRGRITSLRTEKDTIILIEKLSVRPRQFM